MKKKQILWKTLYPDPTLENLYLLRPEDRMELAILGVLAKQKMTRGELKDFCVEYTGMSQSTFYSYKDRLVDEGYIDLRIDREDSKPKKREKFMLTEEGSSYLRKKIFVLKIMEFGPEDKTDHAEFIRYLSLDTPPHLMAFVITFSSENRVKYGPLLAGDKSYLEDLVDFCSFFIYRILNHSLQGTPLPKHDDWPGILELLKDWQQQIRTKLQDSQEKK